MKLEEVTRGRDNNLDLIRFIAAVMVILCHAFPIALGKDVMDPLATLTGDQLSFGSLAVSIFFFYGGFLICKSMCRLKTAKAYFKARIFRIFPPLIFVTLVLTFVVGPVLTNLSAGDYFRNSGTYRYLLNGVLVLQHNLPGVFEGNIYGQAVNGPLWTLPIEFLCYIMCFVMYLLHFTEKKNMKWATLLFSVGCIGVWVLSARMPILAPMIRPVGIFFAGMLYYVFRDRIPMKGYLCALALLGMIVSAVADILPFTIFLFLPYILAYIGWALPWKWSSFAKHGEVSYGMYLCAWPIQQILCEHMCGSDKTMNPWVNFALATGLAIVAGFIVCKLIEEPIVKWTKKNRR